MINNSWILDAIGIENLEAAQTEVARRLLMSALDLPYEPDGDFNLQFTANALQLAVYDLLDQEEQLNTLRLLSKNTFDILRVLAIPEHPLDAAKHLLNLACFGVLGERGADAARFLKKNPWPELPIDCGSWGERVQATILDAWLRLIRKDGWTDLDLVQERVVTLRKMQKSFEAEYLTQAGVNARTAAWELVVLYHLSKAAEILAIFSTQGEVGRRYDIQQQLEAQFDRALTACARAELMALENMIPFLARTARQIVENSIWTVTRAVNSRVTTFVNNLVQNKQRPIFEMLPPQRRTLREAGLLGSSHRSVVVNLPTSSGKTFMAQFRILQAINQFELEQGWVAYLAPTRSLVNQIYTRLRHDFTPLKINVERISPALEVDGLEASLLTNPNQSSHFRVLVTTPEKLDLMLRGGWEEKIGRPLTLVVVDEAHNLAQEKRGIKVELLLATINRECRYAQFLFLTPFIDNATEIAPWLSDSYQDIGLEMVWQPNDRAIVLSSPVRGDKRGSFTLSLKTLHTSRNTLQIPERMAISHERPLGLSWSEVKNSPSKLAAATAQILKERGPLIVLAGQVRHTWSLAHTFKKGFNRQTSLHQDVELVRRFLQAEFGDDFDLHELLEYGVAVHHSGLSDEAKFLMEWLLIRERIQILVATTTIAQGVNFPLSTVVLASHQYPYGKDMPPEDFWNLAGRVGRVDQGSLGIIALVASDEERAAKLEQFVNRNVGALNSTLVDMVKNAIEQWGGLELHRLYKSPEWSAFLQYLAHTYRQIGNPDDFTLEIEQILRGTLGFKNLRKSHPIWANRLIVSVQNYSERIAGRPLKLVDSTGFSWESVNQTLARLAKQRITEEVWVPDHLFNGSRKKLTEMMGILLEIPELRENLVGATGGYADDKDRLASMVSDWVNGASLTDMAQEYFAKTPQGKKVDATNAMTKCCQSIFGRLTQTASWGLAALQTLTFKDKFERLPEAQQETLRNLPARVYYGVNTDSAIAMRLLGVPRQAAEPLAKEVVGRVFLSLH